MNPEVSIIIPVYNASKYVSQCILSALQQDYDGLVNVIVVDNESTDMTFEELEEVCHGLGNWKNRLVECFIAPNIYKYAWHEPTREGLKHIGQSEYFMFLAADDYLEPEFLTNCMKIMQRAPEKIMALQSPIKFFGDWRHEQKHEYKNLEEFKEKMLQRCVVNTPTIVWHRSFYDNGLMAGGHPEIYFGAEDYALYCELATLGHFIWPAPKWLGYNYRIHKENASWGMQKEKNSPQTIDKDIQTKYNKLWKKND